jgi:hypothetical protein
MALNGLFRPSELFHLWVSGTHQPATLASSRNYFDTLTANSYAFRMAKNDVAETTDVPEGSERYVQWFFAAVGLIYGCGFLIVFSFFKSYGVDSADFVEAKYIHVGFLFFMACLVVAVPLWWLVWPTRSKMPDTYSKRIRYGILKENRKDRIKYFFGDPLESFFRPKWSIDATHGIHAGPGVRISMILILWSFVTIVMFAPSEFGQHHPKLLIFNFLTPMAVLILGFGGDLFKGGRFFKPKDSYLIRVRCGLRVWWLLAGGIYLILFLFVDYFRHAHWPMVVFFTPPVVYIIWAFLILFNYNRGRKFENYRTHIGACQWTLYSLQWTAVILQIWVFIWTIRRDTLEVSLWDILFGKDYFPELWKRISSVNISELWKCLSSFNISEFWKNIPGVNFPKGGIYFIFFIILISFFVLRNSYRVKQIGQINDKAFQRVASISMATIVVPLSYISILSFAHNIYPYVPYEKGGGDYTGCHPVLLTFNTNATTQTGLSIVIPNELMNQNKSNCLIMLDENSSFVFLAATNDAAGSPADWRIGTNKPTVYEISREAITCITQIK